MILVAKLSESLEDSERDLEKLHSDHTVPAMTAFRKELVQN
jgi:hypothetical protein